MVSRSQTEGDSTGTATVARGDTRGGAAEAPDMFGRISPLIQPRRGKEGGTKRELAEVGGRSSTTTTTTTAGRRDNKRIEGLAGDMVGEIDNGASGGERWRLL